MHCLNIRLQQEYNQAHQCSESCNDTANTDNGSPYISALQATIVNGNPSFIGYLEAIWRLFKQAFSNKKGKHFFIIR